MSNPERLPEGSQGIEAVVRPSREEPGSVRMEVFSLRPCAPVTDRSPDRRRSIGSPAFEIALGRCYLFDRARWWRTTARLLRGDAADDRRTRFVSRTSGVDGDIGVDAARLRAVRYADSERQTPAPQGTARSVPARSRLGFVSEENLELARAAYFALVGDQWDVAANLLAPEVELHGTVGGLDEGTVARGVEEVRQRSQQEEPEAWDQTSAIGQRSSSARKTASSCYSVSPARQGERSRGREPHRGDL